MKNCYKKLNCYSKKDLLLKKDHEKESIGAMDAPF
jgi:hypothetical protein